MKLVAIYNRQPTIRSSGLLQSAPVTAQQSGDGKPDRFLAREVRRRACDWLYGVLILGTLGDDIDGLV